MPENQNRNEDVFAKYSAMSTAQLQQILREDASKPEGQEETSAEALFYIMEVLAQRRRAQNQGKTPEEALEEFHKYYEQDDTTIQFERKPEERKKISASPRWVKRLAAAAAVVVLIFSISFTAEAFGVHIGKRIINWTRDTFSFGKVEEDFKTDVPAKTDPAVFQGLREALDAYGMTDCPIPSWLPEGYTEHYVKSTKTPLQRIITGRYKCEDGEIAIRISDYVEEYPTQVEQSEGRAEIYEVAGVPYYIFRDNRNLNAAWLYGSYECCISGPLSIEQIKLMIDSIWKG